MFPKSKLSSLPIIFGVTAFLCLATPRQCFSQVYIGTSSSSAPFMDASGASKNAGQSIAANVNLHISNNFANDSVTVRFNRSSTSSDNPDMTQTLGANSDYDGTYSPLVTGTTYDVWIRKGSGAYVHCGTLYIRNP